MDEEEENIFPYEENEPKSADEKHFYENDEDANDTITKVTGMYKDWFLDYASYVILERAVPAIEDGFKPVQRRIMHSMKELDDGRYNKVANIVGHTMQYHPHVYGSHVITALEEDSTSLLTGEKLRRLQGINGTFLYYARALGGTAMRTCARRWAFCHAMLSCRATTRPRGSSLGVTRSRRTAACTASKTSRCAAAGKPSTWGATRRTCTCWATRVR